MAFSPKYMPPSSMISCTRNGMSTARLSVVSVRIASMRRTPMGSAVDSPSSCWKRRPEAAQVLARAREQRLGVGVELLGRVGKVDERHRGEHHALVARHEVVQELAALLALLLHVVGHGHVIVHVGVLPARPVGDVRLHTEQSPLHLAHRLVSGHGDDVYGKRHRAPRVGKLGQKAVLDVGRVVGQVQGARPAAAHPQAVGLNARALGRNGVLERVPRRIEARTSMGRSSAPPR